MSSEQKTKHVIYNTARKICKEAGSKFNMEYTQDAQDLIAELTYKQIQLMGFDLEAFQKHAKRSTINTDDVKLLVRRNDSLKEMVDAKVQVIAANKPAEAATSAAAPPKRKRKM
ncbi:centromere protein S [Aethina tumida]|uniref:centromere protein S n=1 Tax=Aethina tumida TaxID=116153 RepID=UPI00096B27C2|nr:centromere protein S [Aethina tumida]